MRLLGILLLAVSSSAQAWLGAFDVCDKAPQYVRIEVYDGFAPLECPAVAAGMGNPLPLLLLAVGTVYVSCALFVPGTERAALVVSLDGPDAMIGHELRHAFAPHDFHPPMLPFVNLPCE